MTTPASAILMYNMAKRLDNINKFDSNKSGDQSNNKAKYQPEISTGTHNSQCATPQNTTQNTIIKS